MLLSTQELADKIVPALERRREVLGTQSIQISSMDLAKLSGRSSALLYHYLDNLRDVMQGRDWCMFQSDITNYVFMHKDEACKTQKLTDVTLLLSQSDLEKMKTK